MYADQLFRVLEELEKGVCHNKKLSSLELKCISERTQDMQNKSRASHELIIDAQKDSGGQVGRNQDIKVKRKEAT